MTGTRRSASRIIAGPPPDEAEETRERASITAGSPVGAASGSSPASASDQAASASVCDRSASCHGKETTQ
jgi:hypothetical protein